jgi:hypothetical protein
LFNKQLLSSKSEKKVKSGFLSMLMRKEHEVQIKEENYRCIEGRERFDDDLIN